MARYHRASLAELPAVKTVSHGELEKEPADWEHTGDRWRIVIYDYEGWIEFKGDRYDFSPGSVFIFPPNAHFKQDRYSSELYNAYANFTLTESSEHVMALPLQSHLGDLYALRKADWLRCVRRLDVSIMPSRALIFQLLWMLAEPLAKYRKHPALDIAEEVMQKQLRDALSIEEIAAKAEISQNQLIRLFRQEHGMTPVSYLRNRRAEEAKRLLTRTDLPIKEIAAMVGIPNLHYFNAFMREYYGEGPRAIRARALG